MRRMSRVTMIAAMLVAASAATSGATTIAELNANGRSLSGQEITVAGKVTQQRINVGDETTFAIADDLGRRVAVFGRGTAPTVGTQVQVTGTVGFKEPDEEFVWPPVLHAATWQTAP